MIHFVGAGCGSPDLITIKGDKLLRCADVVVWAASLINPSLLSVCKPCCTTYDSSRMTLNEVLDVLVSADEQGLCVVRLHSGDPCLYGAIQEQMDALFARGISFDVVPGVSSFGGAAAALCQEYTLCGVSQTVVITRVPGKTDVPSEEDLSVLARSGATFAIFLSSAQVQRTQELLLMAGRSYDEPAAIVYKASWPDERIYRCTLGSLTRTMETAGITKSALIVVGRVLAASAAYEKGLNAGISYEKSKLYDPHFSTEFRPACEERVACETFTEREVRLACEKHVACEISAGREDTRVESDGREDTRVESAVREDACMEPTCEAPLAKRACVEPPLTKHSRAEHSIHSTRRS